ncbi:MAG: ABC transporter ATP-binding protein [Acidimicrobiia bacterium]
MHRQADATTPNGDVILEMSGLEKSFGATRALAGVDLTIAPGEILALLGRNGAGKTTLLSIAAGLLRPDRGRVEVAGVDVSSRRRVAGRSIGFAPQTIGLYPSLTLLENLEFFGRLGGLRGRSLGPRVAGVADVLDFGSLLDKRVRYLSGGQQRLAHVAAAVIHRPLLLLLDEPSAGLDLSSRDLLVRLLSDHAAEGGAVCYSTHILGDVAALGATLAVIDRGALVARGRLDALLAAHGTACLALRFDGEPPMALRDLPGTSMHGPAIRIPCDDPAAAAAFVLGLLGTEIQRLTSFDLIQPSLESVFFSITGQQLPPDDVKAEADAPMGLPA